MFIRGAKRRRRGVGARSLPDQGRPDQLTVRAGEQGFVTIDVCMALVILSVSLVLSLNGVETARRMATRALETRRATDLMAYLLDTAPHVPGTGRGRMDGFDWTVDVKPGAGSQSAAVRLCNRQLHMTSIATGRRFELTDAEPCMVEVTS